MFSESSEQLKSEASSLWVLVYIAMLILVEVVQIAGQPCQYKITTEIDYVVSVIRDIVPENII